MLDRADQSIRKQLDLGRFLKRQRMQSLNMLTALKLPQIQLIDDASTMLIRESSDLDKVDGDDSYDAFKRPCQKLIFKSTNSFDRCLMHVVKLHLNQDARNEEPLKKAEIDQCLISMGGGHIKNQSQRLNNSEQLNCSKFNKIWDRKNIHSRG